MNKRIAMIPAAGRGTRMLSLTDNNPKAMLPMSNKPIIGHQLEWLIKHNFEDVIIVVGYKAEKIINYVSDFYADKINVRFAMQDKLDGLADAIYKGTNEMSFNEMKDSSLFIILGDLIPNSEINDIDFKDDFIAYDTVSDYERWCMVGIEDGNITSFYDKPETKPPTNNNIIGIYNFSDIPSLKSALTQVIFRGVKLRGEYQLSQALEIFIKKQKIKAVEFSKFYDLGEVEALNKTRKNIARHFNKVELMKNGNIRKSSTNTKKLEKEINWYNNLSPQIKEYVPEIKDFGERDDVVYYDMEYIKSTPLQELFLYNLPEEDEWRKIFKEIKKYLDKTRIKDVSYEDVKNLSLGNYDMFVEKTKERCKALVDKFPHMTYAINGKLYKNPLFMLNNIYSYSIPKLVFNNIDSYFSHLHGDLFFGNMMYDIESSKLKIFDPRGEYGVFTNKGDIRYDIAKLNHSVYGYYDFIVNGLYTLDDKGAILNYDIYDSQQKHAQIVFDEMLEEMNIDKDEIDFITGLLFLTMIPLHSENEKNQKMQFIKACEFFDKIIKKEQQS